jgi:hypothetical protein
MVGLQSGSTAPVFNFGWLASDNDPQPSSLLYFCTCDGLGSVEIHLEWMTAVAR